MSKVERHRNKEYYQAYYKKNKDKIYIYQRKYRDENRQKINERQKQYRKRPNINQKYKERDKEYRNTIEYKKREKERQLQIKNKVFIFYTKNTMKCNNCGFGDIRALSIDHINGGGKKHIQKIGKNFYRWLIKNNFPSSFQVLCMNCQFIKRSENNECKISRLEAKFPNEQKAN